MNLDDIYLSLNSLTKFCEINDYKGWDPFDGLNSPLFKNSIFYKYYFSRLLFLQLQKKSNINLRKLFYIPQEHNPKGLGLFLSGYCNLYGIYHKNDFMNKINYLSQKILALKTPGYSGYCWGYNFDWQNRVFFQPKFTPTVVATSFIANSLFDAYDITGRKNLLEAALSSCDFVIKDLNRTYDTDGGFIFSYSPLDRSICYNASLLGAKLLARGYTYSKNNEFKELSNIAVRTISKRQNADGSWLYGEDKSQQYIDSFHTGYNLESIYCIMKYTECDSYLNCYQKGLKYYLNNFFLDGVPKYYNNSVYPIDIHSPAQFIITMIKTNEYKVHRDMIDKVLEWTIQNMQDSRGYFYYQKNKYFTSKIPYMRWAQAWMFYALSNYIKILMVKNENMD